MFYGALLQITMWEVERLRAASYRQGSRKYKRLLKRGITNKSEETCQFEAHLGNCGELACVKRLLRIPSHVNSPDSVIEKFLQEIPDPGLDFWYGKQAYDHKVIQHANYTRDISHLRSTHNLLVSEWTYEQNKAQHFIATVQEKPGSFNEFVAIGMVPRSKLKSGLIPKTDVPVWKCPLRETNDICPLFEGTETTLIKFE